MFQPGLHTEIEGYLGYLTTQIDSLRESAHGLTEDQARLTPCRSALSIGGLIKHATYVLVGRSRRAHAAEAPSEADYMARVNDFMASFALSPEESLEGALQAYDAAAADLLEGLRHVDPDAETIEPPAPWDNRPAPTPARERFQLVHLIEELARHAGHADIIREQIDGADAMSLHFAVKGLPGNMFVQPWQPAGASV